MVHFAALWQFTFYSLFGLLASGAVAALEVGDLAPDFELPASDGNTYTLSAFRGKSTVVLAWFPQAFTSGCTIECKSLADNGDRLREFQVNYFMASVDPLAENRRFAESMKADFPLLSDEAKSVAEVYGVLYQNRFALRHTFYIGIDGRIAAIDRNVNPERSAEDMIATLKRLKVARSGSEKTASATTTN